MGIETGRERVFTRVPLSTDLAHRSVGAARVLIASDVRIGERPRVPRSGGPHGERRVGRARARLVRLTVRGVPLSANAAHVRRRPRHFLRHARPR